MKVLCVIPARYQSSRFPGKPLEDICGHPMIWWSYQNVVNAGLEPLVATDNDKIYDVCIQNNMNVVMTSDEHPTGVDRLCEVAMKSDYDWYVLVQGDEPLMESATILKMVQAIEKEPTAECVRTFKVPIKNPVDAVNSTIIKIVTDLEDNVLFASRSAIPYPKAGIDFTYFKSVGVYAYPRDVLIRFQSLEKGYLERVEDHDFMRMLENGIRIKAHTVSTETISVDTAKDLERVRNIMEMKKKDGFDFKG